ncbi:hypothetical protein GCG54_00008783 [Colletotrichum gloeosporioides]|uniref:Uncharacterized protein n=1 Tax=Colletotrichum gloeosporioides TaxID=474922 RepID=A0A8H4CNS6_COLGL|nr:uncharacterized protein GCG54_00008783 [Colletotrichum gloeosporioides]KAF3807326.1 hypothetical protein GCG54_00008783 [Colletotrichum gloeosporioides]
MVDCSAQSSHAADYSLGTYKPVSWQPTERFVDFVKLSLGLGVKLENEGMGMAINKDFKASLKAWKLRKRLGIKFQPTNDLTKHLLLDRRRNVLFIFHHVKFLKTQAGLYLPIQKSLGLTIDESLKKGTLPPQLLAETLHSIQAVLFPPHNKKAARILKKLIANHDTPFDPECARYDGETLPKDFRYIYWAKRIADLHGLLEKWPPRNSIERWLQWQSSEGNALLVAFIALLISIIIGIISIGLSAVQIWISWMAWKHPVES